MREQRIELVDQRLHFARQRRGDAAALPPAHRRDRTPDMAQRPQAVEGLERRENDEAERSEEHTSELQSLMRISYAVFCLKKKKPTSHKLIYTIQERINTMKCEQYVRNTDKY